MTRFTLKFIIIIIVTSLSFSTIANDKLLIIGDSLSAGYGLKQGQGWVDLLQNKYLSDNKKITIINTAISGQTTDNALLKVDTWLKTHQPTHVLIELGGNDGIRGFPTHLLQKHLTSLIKASQNYGAEVALMAIQIPPNLGRRYTKMFSDSYSLVAEKTSAYLMPYFMTEVAVHPELMQHDNLHPNEKAQLIICDFMYKEIDTWLLAKNNIKVN